MKTEVSPMTKTLKSVREEMVVVLRGDNDDYDDEILMVMKMMKYSPA